MRKKANSSFVRPLLAWGRANRRDFPWREDDDPFRILVAEVLLQRSRGKTVASVYERLFARWPSPKALGQAGVESIASVIRPLGLVDRARHLKALALALTEMDQVPRRAEELIALPGVGRYAANATLVAAFNQPVPVVDGVTARVYRRYFGLSGGTSANADHDLWELVSRVSPTTVAREWNWAVLDLAAAVCLPKVPRCPLCPVRSSCKFARSVGSH